jgi:hypothetical protein
LAGYPGRQAEGGLGKTPDWSAMERRGLLLSGFFVAHDGGRGAEGDNFFVFESEAEILALRCSPW